ncbi:MAG TPA: hypothetical protein VII22_22195 [Streptosporangiaceae bacterium]
MTASTRNGTTERGSVDQPPVVERITVALIPKAAADLQRLQDSTSLSKTDLVNRAITLYALIDAEQSAGRDVLIKDNESGEINRLLFL